eukprot:6037909-Prymnesium_polylepis.2
MSVSTRTSGSGRGELPAAGRSRLLPKLSAATMLSTHGVACTLSPSDDTYSCSVRATAAS